MANYTLSFVKTELKTLREEHVAQRPFHALHARFSENMLY